MIAGEGHVIYLSGDTDIMAELGWMGECRQPDIGILSAGGQSLPLSHVSAVGAGRLRIDRSFAGGAVIEPEVFAAIKI